VSKSKLSRREFLRWAAIAGTGVALAACKAAETAAPATKEAAAADTPEPTAPSKEPVTVEWWNPDVLNWQPAYEGIAQLTMDQNPGLTVKVQNITEEGFLEKITTMIAADTGPDVWTWYHSTDTARHGFITDLTPFIADDGLNPQELWFPICLLRGQYEGVQYSTPRDGVWTAVMYNMDLFDEFGVTYPEEGWTLDDYLEVCVALTDEDKGTWGTLAGGPGSLSWDVGFCWNMGFEIVSEDGRQVKGLLDSQTSIDAIQWMLDLVTVHKVSPPSGMTEPLGDFPFGSAKVGMADGSGWILDDMRALEFRMDQVGAPVKSKGAERYAWGDSVQYYMWSGAKNKAEAWTVMKTASSVEGSKIAMEAGSWTSPCPETWRALKADEDPILGKWWIEAQKPTSVPNYLRTEYEWDCVFPEFEGIWTRYIENGERPLEMLVTEAADAAQKCLDERYAESES
jgi:multiple sugar transport system substrate-binding protein